MATPVIDEVIAGVRRSIGGAIFERVAGPDGAEVRDRLHRPDAEPRFPPGTPITRVHSDASMFIGGLSALLLQSLHPLAMAGVAEHSGYRGDPWGRLARTSHFLAVTTFGSTEEAQREIDVVKAVHRRVVGAAPDGRPYSATDPHLVAWVHLAEVVSFLRSYQRYGAEPLTAAEADEYVEQSGSIALALGADVVPGTAAESVAMLEAYRPELEGTPAARSVARFLVANPPLPVALRPAYLPIAAAGVSLLPRWARWPLRLPWLPVTEATVGRAAGQVATRTIRWALPAGAGGTSSGRPAVGSAGVDRLVLASASPRRRELLARLGVAFDVLPADVDETPAVGERPLALVRRLAATKARAVDGDPVLAADTIVEVDGEILGKPVDEADARRMLRRLSARSHRVHTGVAIRSGERLEVQSVTTIVTFVALLPSAIDWYLATGEPFDKAGAYAIQGAGAVFIDAVRGSVSNVVGLPMTTVARMLHDVCGWEL